MIHGPDWKKISDYPDPETASLVQWAWEFLRRCSDYRQFFDEHKGRALSRRELKELWNRFAILRLHAPGETFAESVGADLLAMATPIHAIYHPAEERNDGESNALRASESGEIIFKFDVRLPLMEQFEWALLEAKSFKKWLSEQTPPAPVISEDEPDYQPDFTAPDWQQGKYSKPEEYQLHLRILDGLSANADLDQIIATIQPVEDPAKRTDRDSIRRTWRFKKQKAEKLRDGEYRFLCTKALESTSPESLELKAACAEKRRLLYEQSQPEIPSLKQQLSEPDKA